MNFREAVVSKIREVYCAQVNGSPQWFSNLREVLIPGGILNAADAINRWACNTGESPIPPLPPFTGGQCPGTTYAFEVGRIDGGTCGAFFVFSPGVIGPISSVSFQNTPVSGPPGAAQSRLVVTGANGTFTSGPVNTSDAFPPCYIGPIATSGPDDCGDPDPEFPPVGPIEINTDVTYVDEGDNNITIPFGIIFAPFYFDINGQLEIPITIDVGGIELTGEFSIFPDAEINLDFPGRGGGGGNPDDRDLEPGDEGFDGEEPPDGPDETIVAVVVRSRPTGRDRQTLIPDSKGPDILAPGIATLRFACRSGSLTAWTPDVRVKGVNEFLVCPWPRGAVDFSVRWEEGWTGSATAIRGKPLQDD